MSRREKRNRKLAQERQNGEAVTSSSGVWECPRCLQIFKLTRQPDIAETHPASCIEKQVVKARRHNTESTGL